MRRPRLSEGLWSSWGRAGRRLPAPRQPAYVSPEQALPTACWKTQPQGLWLLWVPGGGALAWGQRWPGLSLAGAWRGWQYEAPPRQVALKCAVHERASTRGCSQQALRT